jgi:uncharacterized protein (TIGR02453 family)
MASDDAPSFTPALFTFFKELADNNERTWFNANKARYEQDVKEPALAFVEDVGFRLPDFAPHLVADKKSMFRIYRDTRFAKDKTPYKTHCGIYLRHAAAADADTPGLYLNLEPRNVFMGAGIWHPGSPGLKRIRTAIVNKPEAWRKAIEAAAPTWTLANGEALKRPPQGFPADHPLIDDLKRKSFAIMTTLTQTETTGRGFLEEFETRARASRPFMTFLSDALGVDY